jgi:tetratricopeptide (TPR) repeat protein
MAERSSPLPWIAIVLATLLVPGLPIAAWKYWEYRTEQAELQAQQAHEEKAKDEFEPTLSLLARQAKADEPVDIDKTIRVIHEIDLAMKDQASMEAYLDVMVRQDYRGVAPDVLEARRHILEVQYALYAKQAETEEQRAMWEMTSELLLTTFSVVKVEGDVSTFDPSGKFSIDRQQAQRLLEDLKEEQEEHQELLADVRGLEAQLFAAMMQYSDVYYPHLEEWDRLCVLRDRAYLAARNGDWETVRIASEKAIEMAPTEKEAHLLLALALIEGGNTEDQERARAMLAEHVEKHPDSTAPAFLLLGVLDQKQGRNEEARLNFQQSAAYYPKQAKALTEMLDPYQQRSYLRQSREGSYILELYKSSMLGAGYFSPDLQMAKAAFDAGDFHGGKQKVMDHFARRRSQEQWDFVLQDIDFAASLLGGEFHQIFPEDSYLDLEVAPTMWGNQKIQVGVKNRSGETLHNATLILAVHFTDMHPADYQPFAAEKSMPAVLPRESTDFGTIDVTYDLWGKPKGVSDIVTQRAVLLTDEAVLWVDTDEYKIAEAKEFREAAKKSQPLPEQESAWHQKMASELHQQTKGIGSVASAKVEPKYGFNDGVTIELPKELAVFRPVFTLQYGGQTLKADSNVVDGEHIVLTFSGVDNFDSAGAAPKDMTLQMDSVFGTMALTFTPEGEMGYRFGSAETR